MISSRGLQMLPSGKLPTSNGMGKTISIGLTLMSI